MRVLVTGGAGFIGSALTRELLAKGWDVTVLDNLTSGRRDAVPDGARLIEADVRDLDSVIAACMDADVVYHQAAVKSVPRSMDEPTLFHECNATGTLNVLIAAERASIKRLIYASSSSVYGGRGDGPRAEDHPLRPRSPYAATKLSGEYYCRTWNEMGAVPTVCLRYFNVFGPGQRHDSLYAAVFPAFIQALSHGESPVIHGDGEQSRDFTFIDDVTRANVLAAEADDRIDGMVINVAGGTPRSVNDVFRAVCGALDTRAEPDRAPMRPGDVRHSFADSQRARVLLGWEPHTEWSEAVRLTVEWFHSQQADEV